MIVDFTDIVGKIVNKNGTKLHDARVGMTVQCDTSHGTRNSKFLGVIHGQDDYYKPWSKNDGKKGKLLAAAPMQILNHKYSEFMAKVKFDTQQTTVPMAALNVDDSDMKYNFGNGELIEWSEPEPLIFKNKINQLDGFFTLDLSDSGDSGDSGNSDDSRVSGILSNDISNVVDSSAKDDSSDKDDNLGDSGNSSDSPHSVDLSVEDNDGTYWYNDCGLNDNV